jgi:hypothetical protein
VKHAERQGWKIMTELKAKPVIKNKFWIVEQDGEKVATIQAIDEGGFVYVHDDQREQFPTVKLLKNKLNIVFDKSAVRKREALPAPNDVYGYPAGFKTYNCLYDVSRRLPIFTKTAKSKSYFCAGHYAVKFNNTWTRACCPKLITLQRYQFIGPFKTNEELTVELGKLSCKTT